MRGEKGMGKRREAGSEERRKGGLDPPNKQINKNQKRTTKAKRKVRK